MSLAGHTRVQSRLFSKKLMLAGLVAAACLVLLILFFIYFLVLSDPQLEPRAQVIVGNECRILVETSIRFQGPLSHDASTSDIKAYLIVVDLSSNKPLLDRSRIYGPLWNVANPRSAISYEAGAKYTQEDVEASRATPIGMFDSSGTLWRYAWSSSEKSMVRDSLVIGPDKGSWSRQSSVKTIHDDLHPMSEDRLLTASNRSLLLYHRGQAALFNVLTGDQVDDPWLTQCFATERSIKDFSNVKQFVTEDLNHLVIYPVPIWRRDVNEAIETFVFNGKQYKRSEFGLVFNRPDAEPIIFHRTPADEDGPRGAVSINDRLFLFSGDDHLMQLFDPTRTTTFQIEAPKDSSLPKYNAFQTIETSSTTPDQISIIGTYMPDLTKSFVVGVILWNYRNNTSVHDELRITDLFEQTISGFRPKTMIPVK